MLHLCENLLTLIELHPLLIRAAESNKLKGTQRVVNLADHEG